MPKQFDSNKENIVHTCKTGICTEKVYFLRIYSKYPTHGAFRQTFSNLKDTAKIRGGNKYICLSWSDVCLDWWITRQKCVYVQVIGKPRAGCRSGVVCCISKEIRCVMPFVLSGHPHHFVVLTCCHVAATAKLTALPTDLLNADTSSS